VGTETNPHPEDAMNDLDARCNQIASPKIDNGRTNSLLVSTSKATEVALQTIEKNGDKRVKTAVGHHLLERTRQPIVMLDKDRKIQYRNSAAESFLENIEAVQEDRGYLRCQRSEEDQRLRGEIERILSNRRPASATDRAVVRASTWNFDSPILAVIGKLLPGPTVMTTGEEPLAFVVLHNLSATSEIDPFVVSEAYGLTPAEARVAVLFAQGLSPLEISEKRQVSLLTVRSQVKTIRQKMGARNQTDLVRQLHQISSWLGFEHQ